MKNKIIFENLTGYRGIAALWVVAFHLTEHIQHYVPLWVAQFLQQGYLAVDFFFVLSGFVIALNYFERLANNFSKAQLFDFMVKRIARIYPLHLLIWLAYLSIPLAYLIMDKDFSSVNRYDFEGYILGLVLLNNWGFLEGLVWNVPAWSISTEFGAYLLFPFLVLGFRLKKVWFVAFAAIIICCLSVFALYDHLAIPSIGENIAKVGLWRCLLEFTMGTAIYLFYRQCSAIIEVWSGWIISFGVFFLLITVFFTDLADYIYAPLGMAAILIGSLNRQAADSIFARGVLKWLGDISYSVYLSHYFIKDWMKLTLLDEGVTPLWWIGLYFFVTLLVSHLLFKYYEIPAKNWVLNKALKAKH
ncbi:MAG: peptidoglycan/LPS O-acetylase OafA/YrhL [Paraglaciecola sp.]